MAYIGSTPTSQNFIAGTDYFNGTGSQTAFTLTRAVNSVNDIEVTINNVVQQPNSYTVSGTTLTISAAPSSGTSNVYVRYLSTTLQSITVPNNSITYAKLDSNLQADIQGRNRIINGSFNIWQRGTSSSSAGYLADRWQLENAGTFSQSTDVPSGQGFPYSCSVAVTTGTAYGVIKQKIEGANCVDLVGKTVTLTFWLKNVTGDTAMYAILHHANSLDNFGGVTSIESKSFTAVANTWTKFTLTYVNLPSGAANGLQVYIFSADGSVAPSYLITGVQLEEGTTATSFEREAYSVTLQKCQRYYQTVETVSDLGVPAFIRRNTADNVYVGNSVIPTRMRAAPSVSYDFTDLHKPGITYDNFGSVTVDASASEWMMQLTPNTNHTSCTACFPRTGGFKFSAEL